MVEYILLYFTSTHNRNTPKCGVDSDFGRKFYLGKRRRYKVKTEPIWKIAFDIECLR